MWEGRYGGLASTVIGAHAGGFNTYTFGVSMLGNYDVVDTPGPMIDAVASIIAWKFSLYGVNPRGTTTLTSAGGGTAKYAAGVTVTLPTIFAHRDVGATVCPGQYAYARMGQIRTGSPRRWPPARGGRPPNFLRNTNTSGAARQQTFRGDAGDRRCLRLERRRDGHHRGVPQGRFILFDSNDTAAQSDSRFRVRRPR